MGKYSIEISKAAERDLSLLKRSGQKSDIKKVAELIKEISDEPRTGKGHPEQLTHYEGEVWSRKINKKDRLVYEIYEEEIVIVLIQARGHYNDK